MIDDSILTCNHCGASVRWAGPLKHAPDCPGDPYVEIRRLKEALAAETRRADVTLSSMCNARDAVLKARNEAVIRANKAEARVAVLEQIIENAPHAGLCGHDYEDPPVQKPCDCFKSKARKETSP